MYLFKLKIDSETLKTFRIWIFYDPNLFDNLKNRHYKQPSTNAVDGVLASVYLWSMVYPHLQQIIAT